MKKTAVYPTLIMSKLPITVIVKIFAAYQKAYGVPELRL